MVHVFQGICILGEPTCFLQHLERIAGCETDDDLNGMERVSFVGSLLE